MVTGVSASRVHRSAVSKYKKSTTVASGGQRTNTAVVNVKKNINVHVDVKVIIHGGMGGADGVELTRVARAAVADAVDGVLGNGGARAI